MVIVYLWWNCPWALRNANQPPGAISVSDKMSIGKNLEKTLELLDHLEIRQASQQHCCDMIV